MHFSRLIALATGLEQRVDGGNQVGGDLQRLRIIGGRNQLVREAADMRLELPHFLLLLRVRVVVGHVGQQQPQF